MNVLKCERMRQAAAPKKNETSRNTFYIRKYFKQVVFSLAFRNSHLCQGFGKRDRWVLKSLSGVIEPEGLNTLWSRGALSLYEFSRPVWIDLQSVFHSSSRRRFSPAVKELSTDQFWQANYLQRHRVTDAFNCLLWGHKRCLSTGCMWNL